MGITRVPASVLNPSDSKKKWEGEFIVDTGAVDCLVPRQHLEAIGLFEKGKREYVLADGKPLIMPFTTGDIEFMGEKVGATIIMGEENAHPLLGVTALESAGIEVDPRDQRLVRLPSILLTGFRPSTGLSPT